MVEPGHAFDTLQPRPIDAQPKAESRGYRFLFPVEVTNLGQVRWKRWLSLYRPGSLEQNKVWRSCDIAGK